MKRLALGTLTLLFAGTLLAESKASTPVTSTTTEAPIPYTDRDFLTNDGSAFKPTFDPNGKFISGKSVVLNSSARWPNTSAVPVCWINGNEAGEIVSDLEQHLRTEYARAGIAFNFQGACTAASWNQTMIRVWFKRTHTWNTTGGISGGGGLSYLGAVNARLGGVEGEGTMNIQISRDVTGYAPGGWRTWTQNQTRATATHEFGHAMGLQHEQERNDAPACNDQRGTLANDGNNVFVGAYDPASIMNYCKNGSNVASLTAGDIAGLRYLYPKAGTSTPPPPPPAGTYTIRVKQTNKCLDVASNAKENGTQVQQWDCNGTTAQSFYAISKGNGAFQLKGVNSNRCLDVWGISKENGARIRLYDCNENQNQRFKFQDAGNGWVMMIAQHSSKCFDIDLAGSYAQQWQCSANQPNQTFGFFQSGKSEPIAFSDIVKMSPNR